jgi:hypothetical protein
MGGPCSTNGETNKAYRLLVGKPEGKWPLGRPRRRWEDNIRMYLGEMGWGDVDWIGLAKDRNRWRALVNSVLNLRVPWNAEKLSSGLTSSGLSRSAQLHRVSKLVRIMITEEAKQYLFNRVQNVSHSETGINSISFPDIWRIYITVFSLA